MSTQPGEAMAFAAETENHESLAWEEKLQEARSAFYDIPFEDGFIELCDERGINAEDTGQPRYWAAFSDYAHRKVEDEKQAASARGEVLSPKETVMKELLAATPDAIYGNAFLEHRREAGDRNSLAGPKSVISHFNSLVRTAAEEWPDLSASALTYNLVNVANISVEHETVKKNAPRYIRGLIRGAQHELAFARVLDHTGYKYRPSDTSEDLDGVDYVVQRPDASEVRVDVKASMHKILKQGGSSDLPYKRTAPNHFIVHSMITDAELDDRFTIDDEVAAEKAERVKEMLADSRQIGRTALNAVS